MQEKNKSTETLEDKKNEPTETETNEDGVEPGLTEAIDALAKLLPALNRWAGKYTHVFAEPFEWEGNSYTRLTFDWETLRGADCLRIDTEARRKGGAPALEANSYPIAFLQGMAATACTERNADGRRVIGTDALRKMKLQDCMRICKQARLFLSVAGL